MLPERYKYWVNKLIDSFKSYDTRTRVGVLIQRREVGRDGRKDGEKSDEDEKSKKTDEEK